MRRIHFKDVKIRRYRELVFVGNEQRMDCIDELCHVRHDDLVSMAIEGVQGEPGNDSITDCSRIPEQVTRRQHRILGMPRTPLIHNQFDAMLWIGLTHHGPVLLDETLHPV